MGSQGLVWGLSVSGRRRMNHPRGTVVLEFALLVPILLLLVFGITEFGRAWMTKNIMTQAAREGARYAAVLSPFDAGKVKQRVKKSLIGASLKDYDIEITGPSGDPLTVTATVTGTFQVLSGTIIPGFSGDIELQAQSAFRYEW